MRNETIKSILKESIIEIISGKYKRKRGIKDNSQVIALDIWNYLLFFPQIPDGSDNDESAYSMGD